VLAVLTAHVGFPQGRTSKDKAIPWSFRKHALMGDFTNYYDVLEIGPEANAATVERAFRELARRYHPDNQATGDRARFDTILEAHDTLRDSAKRAKYDLEHQCCLKPRSESADAASDSDDIGRDIEIQNKILSILYVRRRTNIMNPGIGNAELARLSGCSDEHMEFHLWYLKEKGWIKKGDDGLFAITIDGVDRTNIIAQEKSAKKLISDQS
jgi:curved DNA-binding protein CbpA